MHTDKVFKALADPTRRLLLDMLCENNGQTLGQLCQRLDMTRQSATQHLGILEDANLVSSQRRGRAKHHYNNPLPMYDVYERWVPTLEHLRRGLLQYMNQQRVGQDAGQGKTTALVT